MSHPLFELKNVSFLYGKRNALRPLSLTLREGERVALLGANGCGKTTLLRLLAGLIFPTLGEIHYFGKPLSRDTLDDSSFRSFFRAQVGIAFQHPEAQLFCPTVEEEIAFGPRQMGLGQEEVRERLIDLEEIFRLESLLERYPGELSGGEQRRVVMAAVLAVAPSVLLLDEPTAALDPRSRAELKRIFASLAKSGKTLITATHELTGLERDYDRALVFSEDHLLVWDGSAGEIPLEVLRENNLLDLS